MKPSNVIKAIITAILLLAVLFAAGVAFVPSILTSLDNGAEKECLANSKKLLSLLDAKMSADEENMFWYDLVEEGNSSKLVNALNRELDEPADVSGYYIKFDGNYLRMLCSKHPQVLDVEMELPNNPVHIERVYNAPQSAFVTTIHAYGQDAYFAGVPLDAENPEKMIFTDADDTNALFSGITVTASYALGGERVLNPDEYKILVGTIDMSKPAHRKLLIEYNLYPWHTMLTTFDIDIIPNDRLNPLIINGSGGRYEINSWDWMDYFADALDARGEYMEFSPSVVRDGGKYYYFPDGFAIIKESKYNGSVMGARDLDEHDEPAYYVIFDTDTEVYDGKGAPEDVSEGQIRLDEGDVYLWQNKPSKEFGAGWLQVFGEITKIED